MKECKNSIKTLIVASLVSVGGLWADGIPISPDTATNPPYSPAPPYNARAAVSFEARIDVLTLNSLLAIGEMSWFDVYASDATESEYVSSIVSIFSNISGSGRGTGPGQIVKIFGRDKNDITSDSAFFQLTADVEEGGIASTISFEIHTMKGIDLISSPQGPILPGGDIINTTAGTLSGSMAQKNDTLRQDIYAVIPQGTGIQAGSYICHLICKNYLGA